MGKRFKEVMGLVAWLLLSPGLPAAAQQQSGDMHLTMTFDNENLGQALVRLEKSSSYKILFTYDDVSKYRVNGSVRDMPVLEAVKYMLQGKPFDFTVDGKFINITLKTTGGGASSGAMCTCTGHVTDARTNEPVVGAQIRLAGTKPVAITGADGAFSFKYPAGRHKVRVSCMGLKTLEVEVKPVMDIVMEEDTKMLNDVVVTGIFRKSRESYTGSVSTITSDQLEQFRGANLLGTLKNVDASINFSIDNLNGSNPNNIPTINIRGNSSLPMSVEAFNQGAKNNPNTPLVIMDGFEISLTKLMDYNDEEIASINILKDAAATAIYGSRGANGVIVVVSKQPEPGKLRVNVQAGVQLEMPDLGSYHLLNAADKLKLEKMAGLYDSRTDINDNDLAYKEAYNKRYKDVMSGVNTNWLVKPLRVGVGERYNLSLEGGSNEFRWTADVLYNNVSGAMKGSGRKTLNGSITLLYTYKNLTFRNYSSIGLNHSTESPYGSFSTYADQQPYNAPYDKDGNLRKLFDPFVKNAIAPENPLYNATLGSFDKSRYQELINNFAIDWDILPELTLRGQLGISGTDNYSDWFRSPEDTYYTNGSTGLQYQTGDGFLRRGLYRYGYGKTTTWNAGLTLSYNKVFKDVHSLYVGVNWQALSNNTDGFNIALEGFSNEDLSNIGNARQYAQDEKPSGSNSKSRQFGVTGNVNYTYNNRYYLDLSYRMDGNSSYGSNKKYAPFWSAGLGWNVHQERFLHRARLINMLRLKTSYGQTGAASGAAETDAYTWYRYATDNRYMNWTGAVLGGLGNPDLTWQTTKEFNVGTEFSLFDNRLRGTFDVYVKKTDNLLSSINIPLAMGFPSYRANVGKVANRGWEAFLQGYIVRDYRRRINLLVGVQLVYNRNRIVHLSQTIKDQTNAYMLSDATDEDASGVQNLFYEGRPQNAIYAVRSLGIDPSTGQEVFLDKDGKVTDTWKASDKVYLGSAEPLYRGNSNLMFQWGDFTLNASFGFYWGGKTYNSTLRDRVEVSLSDIQNKNVDERVLSARWYKAGDEVFFKKLDENRSKATSRYVMDDNVLELQNVSLQYKLKNKFLQRHFLLDSAIFSIYMNSLFHWGSVRMERGLSYPYARNIQAGVKLLF